MIPFKQIHGVMMEANYTDIVEADDYIEAKNVLNEERRFQLCKLKEDYYILKATNLDFMSFDKADGIHVFDLEFQEDDEDCRPYIIRIRDYFYNLTKEEWSIINSKYGA